MGTSSTDGSLMKLQFEYGEFDTNGDVDLTKNAGNIARQTINFNGLANPFVQEYKYDALDRITEAKETVNSTQTWIQEFGYDRYGNRTSHAETINGQHKPINEVTLPTIEAETNRFANSAHYEYDAVGNLITDVHGRQFIFNGDNKQIEVKNSSNVTIGEYKYDGSGKRIKKETDSEYVVFVYDGFGKLIGEYSAEGPPMNPKVSFTATDPLGSPRVLTDENGTIVSRRDFMPFGEEVIADGTHRTTALKYGVGDNVRQKFTGYERDDETGLDFAEARYYYNNHGRFTAVDPLLASGKSANPQTFNRYAYVMNRPFVYTDPTGLTPCCKEQIKTIIRREFGGVWTGDKTNATIGVKDLEKIVDKIYPAAQQHFDNKVDAKLALNAQENSGGVAPMSTVSESTDTPATTRTTGLGLNTGTRIGQENSKEGPKVVIEGEGKVNLGTSTTRPIAPGETRTVVSPEGSPAQVNAAVETAKGQTIKNLANELDGSVVKSGVIMSKQNVFIEANRPITLTNTAPTLSTVFQQLDAAAINRANEINPVKELD